MTTASPVSSREWSFGSIPTEWCTLPLKYLCSRSSLYGANLEASVYENDGVRFLRTTDIQDDGTLNEGGVSVPADMVADYILSEGDFLISRSGTVGRAYVYRPEDGPCAYAGYLVRYALRDPDSSRWLFYITKSPGFQQWLRAAAIEATIGNVNGEKYANLLVPVPPLAQQRAIADYLDRETTRLDALVAAKERVLGLLAEKRRALITRAVTRGLDPRARLRDSGIPWLGEIPAHWETSKFTWSIFIIEGQVDPEIEPYVNMPLIAPNHIESETGRLLCTETAADQGAISGKYLCQCGDVIYSKIRPALRKATIAVEQCLCSADMYPLRSREGVQPEFLLFFLLSEPFSTWAVLESNRVAMPKINREALGSIRIPLPPPDEQRAIVKHIAERVVKLDNLRASTEHTITLLKERRTALIAAAVTGRIELEGAS